MRDGLTSVGPFLFYIKECDHMHLRTEHLMAINYLSEPRRGGLTMQQIADKCGVSRQTLYDWQDNPVFAAELKKRMIRKSRLHLPDMISEAVKGVTEDRNAAMFKLFLQMNDMLTDAVSVEEKLDSAGDMDAMRRRIEEYQARNKNKDSEDE